MEEHVLRSVWELCQLSPSTSTPLNTFESIRHLITTVDEETKATLNEVLEANKNSNAITDEHKNSLNPNHGSLTLSRTRFDPSEKDPGVNIGDDGLSITSTTSAHTHAYLSSGFSSGRWSWTFAITDDVANDESVCVGAGVRPVQSSSYNSSGQMWMYRCYNGNLYSKGTQIRQISKIKIHPGNRVKIYLDHFQHTLSYTIYSSESAVGKPQGVCFKDVFGEIFPAVAFYGSHRSVELVSLESFNGPGVRFFNPDIPDPTGYSSSKSTECKINNRVYTMTQWRGNLTNGVMDGHGVANLNDDTTLFGTWKLGKLHGLVALVVTNPNSSTQDDDDDDDDDEDDDDDDNYYTHNLHIY